MEQTKEIPLSSGGRAWAWRELRWADELRRATYVRAGTPEAALERIRKQRQRDADEAGIAAGIDAEIELTDTDLDAAAAYSLLVTTQELTISLARWEGVLDPHTGEPLTFPDDLNRLGMRDASELLKGARAALVERAPDPNAGGDRSPSESAKTIAPSTPNGRKTSRRRG